MIHKLGLYIIAAFISLALSSIGATIDEVISLDGSNPEYENVSSPDSDSFFIDESDAGYASLISNDISNRAYTPSSRQCSSSGSFRVSVRRISSVYNIVVNNGDNAIHNTRHSLICFTSNCNSVRSGNTARYLIRLRKFII